MTHRATFLVQDWRVRYCLSVWPCICITTAALFSFMSAGAKCVGLMRPSSSDAPYIVDGLCWSLDLLGSYFLPCLLMPRSVHDLLIRIYCTWSVHHQRPDVPSAKIPSRLNGAVPYYSRCKCMWEILTYTYSVCNTVQHHSSVVNLIVYCQRSRFFGPFGWNNSGTSLQASLWVASVHLNASDTRK